MPPSLPRLSRCFLRRAHSPPNPLPADTDKDGTLDKAEVDAAAGAAFEKLDKDKDGSLTLKEVGHHLSKADFAAAETDQDRTLTKAEFLGVADKAFTAADTDHDGTVDAKEFKTKAGQALGKLLE